MRKIRGFKLGKSLIRVSKWVFRRTRKSIGHSEHKTIPKLLTWGRRLKNGAKALCSARPGSGYQQLREDPMGGKEMEVPKGYMAVYVGKKDGEFHRVLVPVMYFNHPLFGDLLRESEEEFGFEHDGGITIPCRYSEFEKVQTRISAGKGCRGRRRSC